ncbi:hypothetical protein SeMB42_g00421 [Synchytrium endobioticum]|nr:hypothetical protein SeMB42_g00421 [Synchytrium endobioticum]
MKGTLRVESKEGVGTTFTCRIPFKKITELPNQTPKANSMLLNKLSRNALGIVLTSRSDAMSTLLSAPAYQVYQRNASDSSTPATSSEAHCPSPSESSVPTATSSSEVFGEKNQNNDDNGSKKENLPGSGISSTTLSVRGTSRDIKANSINSSKQSSSWPVSPPRNISMIPLTSEAAPSSLAMIKTSKPLQILAAEDNLINQALLACRMRQGGHKLTMTNDGKECVEVYTASPESYDIILMDVQMPIMDGLEASKTIRAFEQTKLCGRRRVPIFAISANAFVGDQEKGWRCGFDSYYCKPVNFKELLSTLADVALGVWQTQNPFLTGESIHSRTSTSTPTSSTSSPSERSSI